MERFCIITNRDKDRNMEVTRRTAEIIKSRGGSVYLAEEECRADGVRRTRVGGIPADIECALVLGGDGTLLQAVHDLAGLEIPVFGVNLGTLGFLAETEVADLEEALEKLFAGGYDIREQMMLCVKVYAKEQECVLPDALNDLVITRSGFSRVIGAEVYINGERVNDYHGDGVIVATPTGSTGYSLSAGGPIIAPAANAMVITPVCPHSLGARSIVVADKDVVTVRVCRSKKTQDEEAIATVDGGASVNLKAQDYIEVRRAARTAKLVKLKGGSFYQVLRAKM